MCSVFTPSVFARFGSHTTTSASAPTNLVRGGTYYLGVQNTNLLSVTYALEVDFTAFAPAGNPKIAVGVMIEGGGYGAAAAAPIAVAVIQEYLKTLGIQ